MKGRDIIKLIIDQNGLDEEFDFNTNVQPKKKVGRPKKKKEPNDISEVTSVSIEYNRAILRVSDPMAARKFGLSEYYVRYEFDGSTMYCYREEDKPCNFSFSCGNGYHTLVSQSVETFCKSVKSEMKRQITMQNLKYPNDTIKMYL